MKKLLGISLMALMVAQSATAAETQKTYAGFSIGQTTSKIDPADWEYDSNINFSLVYGIKLDKLFRVEGELTRYMKADYEDSYNDGFNDYFYSSAYSFTALMMNGYVTAPIDFIVKPYVGAGIGFTNTSFEYLYEVDQGSTYSSSSNSTSTEFAYQWMVGFDLDLENSPWAFSLEYKTLYNSHKFSDGKEDLSSESINLKARYAF